MFTLEDLYNLPNNPTDDHKVAAGLLPKPQPPPAAPPLTNVPPVSPVTPRPAVDWKAKIAATAPKSAVTVPEMPPITPGALGAPDFGTGIPEDTSGVQAAATGKIPELPKLSFKERQALPLTSEGVAPNSPGYWQAEQQRLIDQKQNPWGSEENHPGLLGKIGHVAAKIGNIAGDIVAPGIMANIPGTEMNKQIQLGQAERKEAGATAAEEKQKDSESRRKLEAAEANRAQAEADREPEGKTTPELETWKDVMHGGPNGGPQINPDTKKPYTSLEGYELIKQAGFKPATTTPANTPATPEAIADYQERLRAVGLDAKSAETFSSVPPGTTMGELEKRYTDAKALREMGQKDRENAIHDQERRDNAAEHKKEHDETFADKVEKEGRTLIRYRDPKTGRSVVEPLATAKQNGIAPGDMEEVPAAEKSSIQDARAVTHLLNKKGKNPADMGVKQLIDELDKDGKLGVLTSRVNSFLAGGVGALPDDDPRIMALLDKAELAMTLTMKAHFGVSGGRSPQMLQHFLDMANARKMSGPALRSGFAAVGDYMKDKAEMPGAKGEGGGGAAGGGHSFTLNGKPYENVPDELYKKYKDKPGFKE
jgi:hypothetical protein